MGEPEEKSKRNGYTVDELKRLNDDELKKYLSFMSTPLKDKVTEFSFNKDIEQQQKIQEKVKLISEKMDKTEQKVKMLRKKYAKL
jgi:hypothetical protein